MLVADVSVIAICCNAANTRYKKKISGLSQLGGFAEDRMAPPKCTLKTNGTFQRIGGSDDGPIIPRSELIKNNDKTSTTNISRQQGNAPSSMISDGEQKEQSPAGFFMNRKKTKRQKHSKRKHTSSQKKHGQETKKKKSGGR